MKNRASTHLFILLLIVGLQIAGYVAVSRAAVLRGYQPSTASAVRDLLLYVPILFLVLWLARQMKLRGNWALYTTAILLLPLGMLVQYRLYSDPEYGSRNKAEARAEKTQGQRLRLINNFYDDDKKKQLGVSRD